MNVLIQELNGFELLAELRHYESRQRRRINPSRVRNYYAIVRFKRSVAVKRDPVDRCRNIVFCAEQESLMSKTLDLKQKFICWTVFILDESFAHIARSNDVPKGEVIEIFETGEWVIGHRTHGLFEANGCEDQQIVEVVH